MNKTAIAIAAILTAGAVGAWALGGGEGRTHNVGPDADSVVIGTGVVTGLYFPAGGAICQMLNEGRDTHGLRCAVESTGGSVANINALRSGELDLAIVQSDWQAHALNGTGSFKAVGAFDDLRALFSIHSETFNVLVRRSSGMREFGDLKGKRVNVGAAGSGQRAMFEDALAAHDLSAKDFGQLTELRAAEQIKALCDKKIDAVVYVVAHPNGAIEDAAAACDITLLDIAQPALERLLADHPYYAAAVVPAGLYDRLPQETRSFGLKATLVAPAQLGDEIAYQIVRAVFEGFEEFRSLHPAFAGLDPASLPRDGNSAPLHPGAERYFREKGLL